MKPLTPTEWRKLAGDLHNAKLRPRDLIGLSEEGIREALGYTPDGANRLSRLLSRGGQLAMEIDRLSSRGIWLLTRADDQYPSLLKARLGPQAPPVLFGAGPQSGLRAPAIAIVGSRDVKKEGLEFSSTLGRRCADEGFVVVSGAARGVDLAAMSGALSRGGGAVGVTVDPLERLVGRRELRTAIADELLTLTTPFHPAARWHAGNAMRRNRLIYALAKAAVVVASSPGKGGTRSGALENLKANWVPLYVRDDGSPGNRLLVTEGGNPLPQTDPAAVDVARLTDDPRSTLLPSPQEESTNGSAPATIFEAAWPILSPFLCEPRGEKEVAEKFGLELTQARTWLKQAAAEDRVEVTKRPKRYLLPDASADQLRIDGA
ncbi:MAG TPA: DNA-processing protein DprA [Solirubrobacterales bacterium]|nr:DNA-processing protein DprA [Solirubrobacterales bacterium]